VVTSSTIARALELRLITPDEVAHFTRDDVSGGENAPPAQDCAPVAAPPVLEPVDVVDEAERITATIRAAASGAPAFTVRRVVRGPSGAVIPPPPRQARAVSSKRTRKAVGS
jgi:hypothetical protein